MGECKKRFETGDPANNNSCRFSIYKHFRGRNTAGFEGGRVGNRRSMRTNRQKVISLLPAFSTKIDREREKTKA